MTRRQPSEIRGLLAQLQRDVTRLIRLWPLNNAMVQQAITTAESFRLRAADSIHLATAVAIAGIDSRAGLVMITSDRELAQAATASGLAVLHTPMGLSPASPCEPQGMP